MNNNDKKQSSKKLDAHDRFEIEMALIHGLSFKRIAEMLHRHPISISREIRTNRTSIPASYPSGKDCQFASKCFKTSLCGNVRCHAICRNCVSRDCRDFCTSYQSCACQKTSKPPYVCNNCAERKTCIHERYFYSFKTADRKSKIRRSDSRKGIQIKGLQFDLMNRTIATLVKKGQPIAHICATQKDSIPVCQRSVYNYILKGKLKVRPSDLRRRNGYRKRRVKSQDPESKRLFQTYRIGRTYEDFKALVTGDLINNVVEMDTVKGPKGSKTCLLTLLFVNSNIMLIFLLPDGTQDSVIRIFDLLELQLGLERFQRLFRVILTDNGSEFKNVEALEFTADHQIRTHIFYCDPMASWQKAEIEKNHEYIRYVLPKGTDLNQFTQDDITLLANHINSTIRPSLGNCAPYDMIADDDTDMVELMKTLKLQRIMPKDVNLTGSLFRASKDEFLF